MSISLFEHNEIAYNAVLDMFTTSKKAAVIHPTGTGKSFIGFKLCEDNPNAVVCWLSPSEYIFKTQVENIKKTNNGICPANIKFYTYSKLICMSDEEIKEINPDYIILDEFHRAGAEIWGQSVNKLLQIFENAYILGLSATNIRYLDSQRDMAEELFDGNIASEMTLGEAIVRGILNKPLYISTVYSYQNELKKYEKRINNNKYNKFTRNEAQKYLDELKRTLENSEGLENIFNQYMTQRDGKYIVFCSNISHLEEMIGHVPEWFSKIDTNPNIYKVYAEDTKSLEIFNNFVNDDSKHLKLLFCIDMLNEGIHLDSISGVILFRPTISPIIYKQQIGRALSTGGNTAPIIFDIINNFENLYSIGSIEEEMSEAVNHYVALNKEYMCVNTKFEIIGKIEECSELFDKLNDVLTGSWDEMYSYAVDYYKECGNLRVPKKYKTVSGYALGAWLVRQRQIYHGLSYGSLDDEKINKLNEIGMVWLKRSDYRWENNFEAAKAYFQEHNHLMPPKDYITDDGIQLSNWLYNLRSYRKNNAYREYLTDERINKLDKIGMVWDTSDYNWEMNYSDAVKYYEEHGNLSVPKTYKTQSGISLYSWLSTQRKVYNGLSNGTLTEEQINKLNKIGMRWCKKSEYDWNRNFEAAKAYFEKHHNLMPKATYVTDDGIRLGSWLENLRARQKNNTSKLTYEQIEQLNTIGMVWDVYSDNWEKNYSEAVKYYEKHGDLEVASNYVSDTGVKLGAWIYRLKLMKRGTLNRNSTLTEEQILLLEKIGIVWEDNKTKSWNNGFKHLMEYYNCFGNASIPVAYVCEDGYSLGQWLANIRKKADKLSEDQIQQLNDLNITWNFYKTWEDKYNIVLDYYKEHGNINFPGDYVVDGVWIGKWLNEQKQILKGNRKGKSLTAEQIDKLNKVGFTLLSKNEQVWEIHFEELKKYFNKYGDYNIPDDYIEDSGRNLSLWYKRLKTQYSSGKLKDEYADRLKDIGAIL